MKAQVILSGMMAMLFVVSMAAGACDGSCSTTATTKLALGGKCPVALVEMNKQMDGKADLTSTYQGFEYHFAMADAKKMFDAAPEKYAIQMNGACVVCKAEGKTAQGDPSNFAVYDKKIYIFPSAQIKDMFIGDPAKYLKAACSKCE